MCAVQAHRNIRLPPLPTVRDLIRLYRLRALRQLSQNFLMDERIIDRLVKASGKIENGYVCEVGPGPGGITRSILRRNPKYLLVVEKDPRFLPMLELVQEACEPCTKMDIAIDDVMPYNFENAFFDAPKHDWLEEPPPVHLIGNLPFSVSTHLIIRWLDSISQRNSAWSYGRTRMTLTFQKEVAERMVAPIMSAQRCRLSVMCQIWCRIEHKFTIPGKAFLPKPDVDVGVVTLTPRKRPLVDLPFKFVERFMRTMFHMRQKYMIRNIENLFPIELRTELTKKLFDLTDIDPTVKSFQITNSEYVKMMYAYHQITTAYPGIENYNFRASKQSVEQDSAK